MGQILANSCPLSLCRRHTIPSRATLRCGLWLHRKKSSFTDSPPPCTGGRSFGDAAASYHHATGADQPTHHRTGTERQRIPPTVTKKDIPPPSLLTSIKNTLPQTGDDDGVVHNVTTGGKRLVCDRACTALRSGHCRPRVVCACARVRVLHAIYPADGTWHVYTHLQEEQWYAGPHLSFPWLFPPGAQCPGLFLTCIL